jgi:glycosyltransferase involved in cell wall biosynthesis
MRVLVVSQYFPPEPGATQNRMGAFVDGLVERGHAVTVVCEQPNHPVGAFHPGFGRRPVVTQRDNGRVIRRLWVAASVRKTAARRAAFYGTFAAGAGATVAMAPRHDVALATSPPLPGALTAAAATGLRRTPFVLDVRDLWPTAAEALGELSNAALVRAFARAERWAYRRARAVTATTRPFCAHIDRVAGRQVSVHIPNGALDRLLEQPSPPRPDSGAFVVGYAGNLGIAQGLGIVADAAERLRDEDVRFVIIGGGPLRDELRSQRDRRRLDAIEFRPPLPVERIGDAMVECDALLIPLRDHPLLADFIPSKLYDAMAVGRPAIVAAAGDASDIVRKHDCGVVVPPEDGAALAEAVRALARDRGRA